VWVKGAVYHQLRGSQKTSADNRIRASLKGHCGPGAFAATPPFRIFPWQQACHLAVWHYAVSFLVPSEAGGGAAFAGPWGFLALRLVLPSEIRKKKQV
jgi:hypothetical protein